jgi:predicted nucleotidyltransferase
MKTLTKVVVGSRLHGLHTEKSDWDFRGIHINPLKDILSPFKKTKNTSWIEGNVDDTSYELADFCKDATTGNATTLEVFFSNQIIDTTPTADLLRKEWRRFIDTDKFVLASRGYAHNQYNKMQLFEPDPRTPKFAVAYMRVLWQCARFLESNEFHCQIDEPGLREFLFEVKTTPYTEFTKFVPTLTEKFVTMQARVTDAWSQAEIIKPDYEWIEEFIYNAYTNND